MFSNQHVLLNRGPDFIDAVVEGEGLTGYGNKMLFMHA